MLTLYGPDGLPIGVSAQDLREEISGPTTTGIRSIGSNYPSRGLPPERLARLLPDAEGETMAYLERAEELEEKDLHYASDANKGGYATARVHDRVREDIRSAAT